MSIRAMLFLLLIRQFLFAECGLTGTPPGMGTFKLVEVAGGFARPLKLVQFPTDPSKMFVVEQAGKVVLASMVDGSRSNFLDIQDRVSILSGMRDERGLLGMALHPDFKNNKRFFLNYTTRDPLHTRISEFKVGSNGVGDPSSEKIILEFEQPFSNHNGGEVAFGPDGYLYIAVGDGGSGGDPHGNGQNLGTVLGKILRINVDSTGLYDIPADNPFAGTSGARGEIFAYGLRNPWRFSFDRVTGELWAGDVGQNEYEEIDLIKKGRNYGWNTMEASHCFDNPNCNKSGLELPVFEYPRSDGFSVTGGFVYRGKRFPSLVGSYVFGDFGTGKVWGIRYDGTKLTDTKVLIPSGISIATFAEDTDGELYVASLTGQILKLEQDTLVTSFPTKLSETGCFTSLSPLTPKADFISYEVNSPLWSDGAEKTRYVWVPPGKTLGWKETTPYDVPEGTLFLKNFFLPQKNGTQKIVETRFLLKTAAGYKGFSYAWNSAQTEATYTSGAHTSQEKIWEAGTEHTFQYYYPSSTDCLRCHTASSGGALGMNTLQLNRNVSGGHQFAKLVQAGVLKASEVPSVTTTLPKLTDYRDTSANLNERVRSLMHVQCASCHNPGNIAAQGKQDLRYFTPLQDMKICNAVPESGELGIPGAKLLAPGDPLKSLLYHRMSTLNKAQRMPPIASNRADVVAITALKNWIAATTTCP